MKGEYKMKSSIKHIGEEKYSKYETLAKIIEQNNLLYVYSIKKYFFEK